MGGGGVGGAARGVGGGGGGGGLPCMASKQLNDKTNKIYSHLDLHDIYIV